MSNAASAAGCIPVLAVASFCCRARRVSEGVAPPSLTRRALKAASDRCKYGNAPSAVSIRLRIEFLLLSGFFKGHEEPVVVGRDYQVLFRAGVEHLLVTTHGRLHVVRLGQVTVARAAVGCDLLFRVIE